MKYLGILLMAGILSACHTNTENTAVASQPQTQNQTQTQNNPNQNITLIDVRSVEEFNSGHLSGAHNIVHDQIAQHIAEVQKDKNAEIHLYCRSGHRAGLAMKTLQDMGYTNVKNLGGYQDLLNKQQKTP